MLIDTHCHLDAFPVQTLSRLLDPSTRYLTMGTDPSNWANVLDLSERHLNVYAALGLHPWFVTSDFQSSIDELQHLLIQSRPTAIGEIGLDFSPAHVSTKDLQLSSFEAQLHLAMELEVPVSLHVYKAHNETISFLKRYPVTGVVHSLGSSVQIARQYVDLGFKFGVNGILVRDNASRYHELVRAFGLEGLVLETDAPNILLPGHSKSVPSDIQAVVAKVSQIFGCTETDVISQTTANANHIFHFVEE